MNHIELTNIIIDLCNDYTEIWSSHDNLYSLGLLDNETEKDLKLKREELVNKIIEHIKKEVSV